MKRIISKVLIGLIGASLLVSCTQKEKSGTKSELVRINVDLSNKAEVYDIENDIEPEWDFCALETNDNCLIASIYQIYYKNDLFYIFDMQSAIITVFDRNGRFVSKLDKKGGGPDEYTEMNSFTVVGKNVWIASSHDLICYDENWHAIERQRLTIIPVQDMVEINGCIYLASNWMGMTCQVVEYDIASKQQNCLMTLPKYDPRKYRKISKQSLLALSEDGNNSLFIQNFCDTIFRIGDHQVTPQYRFSFSERYEDIPLPIEEVIKPTDRIRGFMGISKTPNSIILPFLDKAKVQYAVYNEEKGTSRVYTKFGYADLGNLTSWMIHPTSDGEMIWAYDPEAFLEMIDESKIKNEADRQKIHAVLSNLKKDDNPILFKFKLKKGAGL
jgi:hypothetical protein